MIDKELLRYAAYAIGHNISFYKSTQSPDVEAYVINDEGVQFYWSPFTNGYDAMKLAADLKIDVTHLSDPDLVVADHPSIPDQVVELVGEYRYIAMCRAITRAAALIGKQKMNEEYGRID